MNGIRIFLLAIYYTFAWHANFPIG